MPSSRSRAHQQRGRGQKILSSFIFLLSMVKLKGSNMTAVAEEQRPGVDVRSLDEIEDALDQLVGAGLERLVAKAGAYALGTGVEPMDLFHEAVRAVLDGSRSWPGDVSFEVFLVMSMKGIAWNLRRKSRRTTVVDMSVDGHVVQVQQQSSAPDTEAQMLAMVRSSELRDKVHDLFADDEPALAVVLGRFDELSVQEICDFGNFDRKTYEAVSKRVQRKLGEAVRSGAIQ